MLHCSVPNLLSALRIALAFICLSVAASPGVYLALTAAAVATDYLDGLAARLLDQRSRFGVVLDIIADNVLRTQAWMVVFALALQGLCLGVVALEWATLLATQTLAGGGHWKEVTDAMPWHVRVYFANSFHNPVAMWGLAGLFLSPVHCYLCLAAPGWASPRTVWAAGLALHSGRLWSAAVEVHFLRQFHRQLQADDRAGR